MKLIKQITPNKWIGGNRMKTITMHHWDNPQKKPSLSGVISWLMNPASEVGAHYVVAGDVVYQLAEEDDRAWHAMQANDFSIGIEVDPRVEIDADYARITYRTLGELVRGIRSRRGDIPLKRHSDYVNTSCPGSIDLARIDREANKKEGSMEDIITDAHKYLVRVINSEVKGWNRTDAHGGKFDEREMKAWKGQKISHFSQQAWNEGRKYREIKDRNADFYKKYSSRVENLDQVAQLQDEVKKLKAQLDNITELERGVYKIK